jgi:hypothetical protein
MIRGHWTRIAGAAFVFFVPTSSFRFLGEVVFAGFLDMAVGDSWFRHEERTLRDVVRDLPWVPLVIVDVVVVTAAVIGLALFVVPGVIVYTFWGLAGPVVVQERHRWRDGLRRTYQISRPHWGLVLVLVVIPLGFEHALAHAVRDYVDQWGALATVGGEWFIAATMLGVIGVVDVALANELMARTPFTTRTAPVRSEG